MRLHLTVHTSDLNTFHYFPTFYRRNCVLTAVKIVFCPYWMIQYLTVRMQCQFSATVQRIVYPLSDKPESKGAQISVVGAFNAAAGVGLYIL